MADVCIYDGPGYDLKIMLWARVCGMWKAIVDFGQRLFTYLR